MQLLSLIRNIVKVPNVVKTFGFVWIASTALLPDFSEAAQFDFMQTMPKDQFYQDSYGNRCIDRKNIKVDSITLANSAARLTEQSVSFKNSCAIRIPLRVCYARTKRCKEDYVMPLQTKKFVLGFEPGGATFSFEYYELIEFGGANSR